MADPKINIRTRNVNSKRLFREIDEFIKVGVDEIVSKTNPSDEHVEFILGAIEEWLESFVEKGQIVRHKVVRRKNEKHIDIFISYTQKNCLNTTSIEYTILNCKTTPESRTRSSFY